MSHLYQQYRALELDGSWIGLEVRNADPWFCTPIGAEIIGWDGAIYYCFVPGFAETVFCVNPENYGGHLVYPIARSFADFLSLLLAVGHTNSLQQVIGWKREEFERFLRQQEEVDYISSPQVQQVLKTITEEIGVVPQPDPFGYIKRLQEEFPYEKIVFSNDYYDILGLERPDGTTSEWVENGTHEGKIEICFRTDKEIKI